MFEQIQNDVKDLLAKDNTGHGFDHVQRVFDLAMNISKKENANQEIVALASLLHDVDDYKLFGKEYADNLINAKNIMQKYKIDENIQLRVCVVMNNMGY